MHVIIRPLAERTGRPGRPTAIRFPSHGPACSGACHLVSVCTHGWCIHVFEEAHRRSLVCDGFDCFAAACGTGVE